MKAVTILLKDLKGNYINVTSTALIDEAKPLFKNLKAQARLCKEKGVPEAVIINGNEIQIQGIWLFSEPTDKYISILGHSKAGTKEMNRLNNIKKVNNKKENYSKNKKQLKTKKKSKLT